MGIQNAALAEISGLLGNIGSKAAFTYLATGTGTGVFDATDTILDAEITTVGLERVQCTGGSISQETTTATDDTLRLTNTFTVTGAGASVGEVAIFNASSTGTMLMRQKLGTVRALVAGDSYVLQIDTAASG
jgi:hypothetical protein